MEEMFKTIDNVVMRAEETQDKFIFSILSKYAMDNFQLVIEKEELIRAIQLIRMYKEHGPGIGERWTTAVQQTAELNESYRRGFHDGVIKEHDRIMNILEKENENDN